jgi:hypothetical protein
MRISGIRALERDSFVYEKATGMGREAWGLTPEACCPMPDSVNKYFFLLNLLSIFAHYIE